MLLFLDILLTIVHLLIIGMNLFGWIFPATRKLHLVFVVVTAASWFILGLWYGIGYCPITDWQWDIKEQRGATDLPASFITYYANKLGGGSFSDDLVNKVTGVVFVAVAILSVYVNFFRRKRSRIARSE